MTSELFVDIIRERVVERTIKSIKENIAKPLRRNPDKDLVSMSDWYKSLNADNKGMADKIIEKSVKSGLFTFLCLLDGVIAFEDIDKGELKLYYEKADTKLLINDENKIVLHDQL